MYLDVAGMNTTEAVEFLSSRGIIAEGRPDGMWKVYHAGDTGNYLTCDDARLVETSERLTHIAPCVECGRTDYSQYCNDDELRFWGLCFHCEFWVTKLYEPTRIISDTYQVYSDCGISDPRGAYLGFSGRWWRITPFEGRESVTNNLWSSGEVPEHFRDRFSPNSAVENIANRDWREAKETA